MGDIRRGDKVNLPAWEMTRAEPCREAQAAWDRSQQGQREVYSSGCPEGCPRWAGVAALCRWTLRDLGRAWAQGLGDKLKQQVKPKLWAWLAGMLAGRRGDDTVPQKGLKEEAQVWFPWLGGWQGCCWKQKIEVSGRCWAGRDPEGDWWRDIPASMLTMDKY